MSSRKRQRLSVRVENDIAIVALADMEIWDGADLALLRESITALIENEGYRAIGVDLSVVKYIPSGFFGMLFEWYEQGLTIRLYSPRPNVAQMLWFRMFFTVCIGDSFQLTDEAVRNNSPNEQVAYHKREFMDDGSDENDLDKHIKAVRFGVRTAQHIP
jgi:hypothetical protein